MDRCTSPRARLYVEKFCRILLRRREVRELWVSLNPHPSRPTTTSTTTSSSSSSPRPTSQPMSFSSLRESQLTEECGVPASISGTYGLHVCEVPRPEDGGGDSRKSGADEDDRGRDPFLPDLWRKLSPVYMRDNNDQVQPLLEQVASMIPSKDETKWVWGQNVFLVNCPDIVEKMTAVFPSMLEDINKSLGSGAPLVCSETPFPGIWALHNSMPAVAKSWQMEYFIIKLINHLGATPSLYTLFQVASSSGPVAHVTSTTESNQFPSSPLDCPQLCASKTRSPGAYIVWLASIRLAQASAVNGLVLEKQRHIIESAIDSIVIFQNSSVHVARFFEVVANELSIGLCMKHPYDIGNFREAWWRIFSQRHPTFVHFHHSEYLVSSGMDAITSCLHAAGGMPTSLVPGRDYIEAKALCLAPQTVSHPDGRIIFYFTPNPSFPFEPFSLEAIKSKLSEPLAEGKPVILIVDITVETYKPLDSASAFLASLHDFFSSGLPLCLLIVKSFVKYATLGTGKAMGGGILLVRDSRTPIPLFDQMESSFRNHQDSLNWISTLDGQFLTHILKFCPRAEIDFITNASHNTEFFHQECWDQVAITPGLPFATRLRSAKWKLWDEQEQPSPHSKTTTTATASTTPTPTILNSARIAEMVGMEEKDSFSSLHTSFLTFPSFIRFNIGQETHKELLQKYSALGLLFRDESGPGAKTPVSKLTIENAITEASHMSHPEDRILSLKKFSLKAFPEPILSLPPSSHTESQSPCCLL
ncbi:hypothetical protein Pelo_7639 [Pelomyxa schiedti]|nr:hypothetical protein Pelo_7639 [Pelomyxa schiedti]